MRIEFRSTRTRSDVHDVNPACRSHLLIKVDDLHPAKLNLPLPSILSGAAQLLATTYQEEEKANTTKQLHDHY
jgi:hypothetical protein